MPPISRPAKQDSSSRPCDIISGNYIRNSTGQYGVYDHESFNNTYVGNIATSNGSLANTFNFWVVPDGFGPVTMVNNVARLSAGWGYDTDKAFSASVPGPPYSLFSGNRAVANGTGGFYEAYSVGATWSKNVAYANAGRGFWFYEPWRETITGNSANMNGSDGFYFENAQAYYQPLAVTNNAAWYNGGYGFNALDYPVAGNGNTGGGTNSAGDCYLVAGCS